MERSSHETLKWSNIHHVFHLWVMDGTPKDRESRRTYQIEYKKPPKLQNTLSPVYSNKKSSNQTQQCRYFGNQAETTKAVPLYHSIRSKNRVNLKHPT